MTNAIARFTLTAATAAAFLFAQRVQAQDGGLVMPERHWVKAERYFSAPAAPAATPARVAGERAWRLGPAFAVDSVVAPAASGREWRPNARLSFGVETASYVPSRYGMVAGLPTRDTAVAARFEFRF